MKKINNIIFSIQLTGILLMLFALTIGFATFIENDFGTEAAKAKFYNARWFEFILLLLSINLTGSIFRHKMYLKEKWTMFLFHISFLVIFIGAASTRYIGFEGMMSIREGQSSDEMTSDKTYISVWADDGNVEDYCETRVFATPASINDFDDKLSLSNKTIIIEALDYYTNVAETIVEEKGGKPIVWFVVSDDKSERQNLFLEMGDEKWFGVHYLSFNTESDSPDIRITYDGSKLYFRSVDSVQFFNMAANTNEVLPPDEIHLLEQRALYKVGKMSFVVKKFYESGKISLTSTDGKEGINSMDAILMEVTIDNQSKLVRVFGGKGYLSNSSEITVNGVDIKINYGAKLLKIPFSIRLDDFQLERYPGSNSPSSYASQVTVIDKKNNIEMPYRIFMNNVLNYRGYRFFQSSYDRDEKGTILSVNHDGPGTVITYIGYFLMTFGMFVTIFNRHSRFRILTKLSAKLRESRKTTVMVFLVIASLFIFNYPVVAADQEVNETSIPEIKKEHAEKFGKLLVQDKDGRFKPVNTLASEVLRKISRKNKFEGMNPEQVFLGILVNPEKWQTFPMIKISHPELQNYLGLTGKYAQFNQIIDVHVQGGYKLKEYVGRAYNKNPAKQNKFDKEVIKVDERVNIFYMVYSGTFLNIFPVPGDINHKWVTSASADEFFTGDEALFIKGILSMYYNEVNKAIETGDWTIADEHLGYILQFQRENGKEIIPSDSKIDFEIFYNEFNIFKRLTAYYGLIGFVLLILHVINILKPKINLKIITRIASILIIVLFLIHTAGLTIRWYISGHAPWSDGYESLIYIGWATILSGLIFVKRSEVTLSVTALLTSVILMVAGLSWMDPEITNLVPVLKSYWLVIHVAIITASYGFLALGSLLGFFNLILMNLKTKKNVNNLNLTIIELTHVIEMALIIGLFMLTIGTFLGGVWANESWGRYWGWDPKETWALVTVLVYSFIVHMRFIPGFRGNFSMSLAALISFSSVLMTYFGVNYYLSGLHSYAKGDPVPVPMFVYYSLIVVAVVSVMAYFTERKFNVRSESFKGEV